MSCNTVKVIKINLNKNNTQTFKIKPSSTLCYSTFKVEGRTVFIPSIVPLSGTIIVNKRKETKIYLFYRSSTPVPSSLEIKLFSVIELVSRVESCVASQGTINAEVDLSNVQFLLIGAGGKGGRGGTGGDGVGGLTKRHGGGGGGGGSSGTPGEKGEILYVFIGEVPADTIITYTTGVSCGDKSTTLTITPPMGKSVTYKVFGGKDGQDGNDGEASKAVAGGNGGSIDGGNSGGEGGHGGLSSFYPASGENGTGPKGGKGGGAASKFLEYSFSGGGGGGGASGAFGPTVNFINNVFVYTPTQADVFTGGFGGHGTFNLKDGGTGTDGFGTFRPTPRGCGGNGGAGGGGGGGTVFNYAGGGGGRGSLGFPGGDGIIFYYKEKKNTIPP